MPIMIKHLGCSFRDEGIGAVLLADRDSDIHGFLKLPEAAVLHPGPQHRQGAGYSPVVHVFSCQQPQDLEEITLVEIRECQDADIFVKESVSFMGTEADLVMQNKLNTIFDQALRFFCPLVSGNERNSLEQFCHSPITGMLSIAVGV